MPISNALPIINFPDPASPQNYIILSPNIEKRVTTTATVVVSYNSLRKGLTIYNSHSEDVFFDCQPQVTEERFWLKLQPGSYYEMPLPVVISEISAITLSGTGTLHIREIVV